MYQNCVLNFVFFFFSSPSSHIFLERLELSQTLCKGSSCAVSGCSICFLCSLMFCYVLLCFRGKPLVASALGRRGSASGRFHPTLARKKPLVPRVAFLGCFLKAVLVLIIACPLLGSHPGRAEYSTDARVGRCSQGTETLTLFKIHVSEFPTQTEFTFFRPCLRHLNSGIQTRGDGPRA